MENFKSGFVSIIGRTNVGKSTLINSLVGEKVAIMANKTQTTRTAIRAIVNRKNSQIVFIDTPGIHKPKTKLGNTMIETAFGTISEVDVILFMVEATSDGIGRGDTKILEKLKETNKKVILIINKKITIKCDLNYMFFLLIPRIFSKIVRLSHIIMLLQQFQLMLQK